MSLREKIASTERGFRLLLEEMGHAKHEARLLEEENLRLRRQLCQAVGGDYAEMTSNGQKIQATARESLTALYSTGFHICHLFFGRPKQGECLFCLALLGD